MTEYQPFSKIRALQSGDNFSLHTNDLQRRCQHRHLVDEHEGKDVLRAAFRADGNPVAVVEFDLLDKSGDPAALALQQGHSQLEQFQLPLQP